MKLEQRPGLVVAEGDGAARIADEAATGDALVELVAVEVEEDVLIEKEPHPGRQRGLVPEPVQDRVADGVDLPHPPAGALRPQGLEVELGAEEVPLRLQLDAEGPEELPEELQERRRV